MVTRPAAIVIVNDDLSSSVRAMLIRQLHITQVLDGDTFDERVVADSNYVSTLKQLDQRVLVIRPLTELDNRDQADVVAFVSRGLFSTLQNNYGPPVLTLPVLRLDWGSFGIH